MKRLQKFIGVVCLTAVSMLQACSNEDGHSLGDIVVDWATVRVEDNTFYLQGDGVGSLWLVNTNLGFYRPVDGQRILAYYNPLYDNFEGYDQAVRLLDFREALTKQTDELTEENAAELGNDPILIYKGDMGFGGGYMNLIFYQNLPKDLSTKHRISLVEVKTDTDDGYVHLKLLYNTYGDKSGRYVAGLVSFNLDKLEIPDNTKGFKVQLNSEENGEVEVTFDRRQANQTINAEGLEFSKMQLE